MADLSAIGIFFRAAEASGGVHQLIRLIRCRG